MRRRCSSLRQVVYVDNEVQFSQKANSTGQMMNVDNASMHTGSAGGDPDVRPHLEDTVSRTNSTSSQSIRIRIAARKAALEAETKALKQKHELQEQAHKINQKMEMLDLQTKLAMTEAEAKVYESSVVLEGDAVDLRTPQPPAMSDLNPLVPEWQSMPQQGQRECAAAAALGSMEAVVKEPSAVESLLAAVHMPQSQLMTFDGNPLHYWTFIRFFENSVERVTKDSVSRLTRLLQYCTGKAKKVVQCCAVMEPNEGYARARALLKERFGDSYVITEAWLSKVTEGRMLSPHDKEELQEYADDLQSCEQTLKAMNYLSEVNTQRVLVKIVARLPMYLQNRWVKQACDIRLSQGRSAQIQDLVSFVSGAAKIANDPVYGSLMTNKSQKLRSGQNHAVKANFNVAAESVVGDRGDSKICGLCGGSHTIFQCEEFRKLIPEERCQFAREKKLCFNCLLPGHHSNSCKLMRTCSVPGCGRKHTKFLHIVDTRTAVPQGRSEEVNRNGGRSVNIQEAQTGFADTECMATGAGAGVNRVALPLVPVQAFSPDGSRSMMTYALLDSGSTTTFCTKKLAESLRLDGKRGTLSLNTLEKTGSSFETLQVSLDVADVKGENVVHVPSAYTRQSLPISAHNAATYEDVKRWPHLNGIVLHCEKAHTVDLLIGQDCPEALMPLEIAKGEKNAPYAVKTMLGWTIQGPVNESSKSPAVVNFVESDAQLQECVEKFWKLDSDECLADDIKGMSVSDRRALSVMEDSIRSADGHYEMAIPFKHRPVSLPNNRTEAEKRLQYLSKRLNRDQRLLERYRDSMEEMVTKGYASEVAEEEVNRSDGAVWYLPHHPVLNPRKPDKIRIVFDCAARYKGTSLNDQVLQGPDLTNQLIGVLLRFRQEPVAIMADIEAMFHQVRVACSDRDVLRYLWWPGGELIRQPQVYRMNVHLFGGTWSPSCCNFALQRVAQDNQNKFSADTVKTVQRNFYVDDCLKSVEDEDKAVRVVKELSDLLRRGGFKLTKWTSTSRFVLASIPEEDRVKDVRNIDLNREALPVERALGVFWDVEDDCFSFKVTTRTTPPTRRGLLSTVSSIYDPFGFIAPCTLTAKKIIQDLTVKGLGWDEQLGDEHHNRWVRWLHDLPKLESFRVGRCLKPASTDMILQYELHHFSDASEIAYGMVTYMRVIDHEGAAHCNLLMAKSRLTPKKTVTIPRLELMAATLSVKMDRMMRRELDLPLSPSVFWTDSTIVLQYINCEEKRFKTFVANRIALIRDASSPQQWRHVSSAMNPADDLSRGLTADEMLTKSRWVNGPAFLWQEKSTWPKGFVVSEVDQDDVELKSFTSIKQSFSTEASQQSDVIDRLLCRRSNWVDLRRDVAWLLRYKNYLKNKVNKHSQLDYFGSSCLSVRELKQAEIAVIQFLQRHFFHKEIVALQNSSDATDNTSKEVKRSSGISQLNPVLSENGTLCVGGRLRHAPVDECTKHPVILPRKHHVVRLIVRHVHETSGHVGREHVLSLLREKYWIIRGRSLIREVLSECITCRRYTAQPGEQKMADLPTDRVTPEKPPFSYVGVDLFGPFVVKRGRCKVKRYGCIFTCLVIRAIHIEIVHSLDIGSFLNALQRFICRRGRPVEIRSDNGTNFKGAERELKEAIREWNKGTVQDYLHQKEIEWKFNPPTASHMGGVWERQIRTVRKVLSSLTKEQTLDDEGLSTLMCQAEEIVNSRPLTTVSDDPNDLEALTPNHLLNLRHDPVLPPGIFEKEDLFCKRRWKQVQYMTNIFWRRWTHEYLPLLQSRQKWTHSRRNFEVGDVVLVVEDTHRNLWHLGRVQETYKGDDGHVRSVLLKTKNSLITRPVTKICLLEMVREQPDISVDGTAANCSLVDDT